VGFVSYGAMSPADSHDFTDVRLQNLKSRNAILEIKLICVQKRKESGMGKIDTAKLLLLYVLSKKMKTDRFEAIFMDAISYQLPGQPPVFPMESIATQLHFRQMRTHPAASREVWDESGAYTWLRGTHIPGTKPFLLEGKTEILQRSQDYYSTLFRHGMVVDDVKLDDVCGFKPRSKIPTCK
jgi:hypothetical protein